MPFEKLHNVWKWLGKIITDFILINVSTACAANIVFLPTMTVSLKKNDVFVNTPVPTDTLALQALFTAMMAIMIASPFILIVIQPLYYALKKENISNIIIWILAFSIIYALSGALFITLAGGSGAIPVIGMVCAIIGALTAVIFWPMAWGIPTKDKLFHPLSLPKTKPKK